MKRATVFILLVCLVVGAGTAWAIDYTGEGSNCSVPPFVRQGAPPNVLLDISVETPMQGAAHPDITCTGDPTSDTYGCSPAACRYPSGGRNISNCYNNSVTYYGYFDSSAKYSYDTTNKYFYKNAAGAWSGNFLNWSTMMAIDAVRKAFTGGNRDTDTVGNTILLRADQRLWYGDSWFPIKETNNGGSYTPHAGTIYIVNRGKGFAVCSASDCNITLDANRFPTSAAPNGVAVYNARVKVCDSGAGLESNCEEYGSGNYKPVGVLQRYADNMRFGLITYALGPNDASNPSNRAATNGGVIRANMKWICPTIPKGLQYHNSSGTLVTCTTDGGCTNPESEINTDGTFVDNPDGVTGGNSGVINYMNKFGYQQGYKSHDPISEMYYEAIRYYKNLGPTTEYTQYDNGTNIPTIDDGFPVYANRSGLNWRDPIIYRCQQNFIIGLNDANPWYDKRLPGTFFTTTAYSADGSGSVDGFHPTGVYVDHGEPSNPDADIDVEDLTELVGDMDGITNTSKCIGCVPGGTCDFNSTSKVITNLGQVHGTCYGPSRRNSYYIAGLAYYAHTNDLRDDHDGMQNITTYLIDSQETNASMLVGKMNMLYLAAKYGGFVDRDGNNQPNLQSEWDKNSNGFPDTYFFASDPSQIGSALETTFGEILQKTSSGTAVSVLSTSAAGEGSLFQAFFNPAVYEGSDKISWVGYLNALWVDHYGNLREDTGKDTYPGLVLDEDYVIEYALNATGDTVVNRYRDLDGNGRVDAGDYYDTISIDELAPTYDYGKTLAETDESARTIYTFMDAGDDGVDAGTERIEFTTANATNLYEYLNATDSTEATEIINFIRGGIVSNCRNRQIDGDTWKLGDIVYSTPSVVGRPMGQYHLIYGDTSYLPFIQAYKDRETVVYVGANDGMIHAFSAGFYHEGDNSGTSGKTERGWYDGTDRGTELWGYIPYSLLPHLKWLTDPDYCHVYFVDLKTRVVDARIFTADSDHPNGWGTVLIGAMRLGGTPIAGGPGTRTYRSAYFALDITNPDASDPYNYPKLLWEYWDDSDEALGYTYSYPTIIRRGAKSAAGDWYVIFGSGPSDFDGSGATTGYVYVLDLATGTLARRLSITDTDVVGNPFFLSSPITIDRGLDNQVNVAYIGASYDDSGWKGKIFRIDTDDNDPSAWSVSTFFTSEKPITSSPTAALDPFGRLWIFWGSGRYFSDTDKADSATQRLYGVWDPGTGTFNDGNLNEVTDKNVYEGGYVDYDGDGDYDTDDMTFSQYLTEVRGQYGTPTKYGWYLDITGGERFLTKPTILGNIVLFPTFDPNDDLCDYGGDSYLFALYYETGTAYMKSVIGTEGTITITVSGDPKDLIVKKKYLGPGMPTSAVIHAGSQEGVKAMVQLGTGVVEEVDVDPAASPKSKTLFWRESGN
jgi:Tfp pilus tip-associated adhesin PilY1